MKLETLVQQQYDRMSVSDHMIWQYICHHRQECRSMSLHQLADACQVSHTTVLRFIQLLGMEGFSEFKVFLKWEDRKQPAVDVHSIEKNAFNLNRTISSIEKLDCTELFQKLEQADSIYAYGSGSAQKSAARLLKNSFTLEEKLVHIIEGREERNMALHTMHAGDVVFLFSVSGNNAQMNDYAAQLHEHGLYLVSVCQDGANELAKLCNFNLPFYTEKFEIGRHSLSYYSTSGMFIIAEMLSLKYAAYQAAQNPE